MLKKLNMEFFTGKAATTGSAVSEKVRTRLEELDDLEEVRKFSAPITLSF